MAKQAEASETLVRALNLSGSPVAIHFAHDASEIPASLPQIGEQLRHCQMVNIVRKEGKSFYATVEKHQCHGGAWALGLKPLTATLSTGEFYYTLGKFSSWAACRRTIGSVPHVETGYTHAMLYAPLGEATFSPHVVLIVGSPRVMLKLAQSTLYERGGRIHSEFSGIQSVCSDACAQTYLSGEPNFSLGCDGSRRFSGIAEGEMVMGFPGEMLPGIVNAVTLVTAAPGSK